MKLLCYLFSIPNYSGLYLFSKKMSLVCTNTDNDSISHMFKGKGCAPSKGAQPCKPPNYKIKPFNANCSLLTVHCFFPVPLQKAQGFSAIIAMPVPLQVLQFWA